MKKRQGNYVKGEGHYKSYFTKEQVLEIRDKRSKGVLLKVLAFEYNTTPSTISDICVRKTWKHV